jgi:nitroreductase
MDALEAIRSRRSVRRFDKTPIDRATLETIVDAGRQAATARNVQPWAFVVVTDGDDLRRLAELTGTNAPFLKGAGACVAVFCEGTKYFVEDGSAATQNMLVAATALGLGSCWVAGDKKDYAPRVADFLKAPATHRLMSLVVLGHGTGPVPSPSKRSLADVVHWERF